MDESPNKPNRKSGFILTKSKTKDSATKDYQIARPQFKTGVWKFINFFIRHKNQKRITSQKSLSPVLFNANRDFLEDNRLRNDYEFCLVSEELGDQSKPFDKELLMENEKIEGETPSRRNAQNKADAKKFFNKMNMEGLMKLFADLHRKKRAKELTKPNLSVPVETSNPISPNQEREEKETKSPSQTTLKQEASITEESLVAEKNNIKSTNIATPANSPEPSLNDKDINEEDGTLNLLECVRTKLADYLSEEESVNSLRATYNETKQCDELTDNYWSRRVFPTLDNDSLKYESSCDDISSLRNNSLQILSDDVNTQFSKDSIYSRQSFKGNNFDLNQSFLEEDVTSEVNSSVASSSSRRAMATYQLLHSIPFNNSTDQMKFPKMLSCHELTTQLQDHPSTEINSNKNESIENSNEEVSEDFKSNDTTLSQTCDRGVDAFEDKTSSLCTTGVGSTAALIDDNNSPVASSSSKTMGTHQLLHSIPFNNPTDQMKLPKMLSCHELNSQLQDHPSTEINSNKNESIENSKEEVSEDVKSNDVTLSQTCDRGVDAFEDKTSSLCTTGVGSTAALIDDESKSNQTTEILNEDLMNLEDETFNTTNDCFDIVAIPTGSQDIIDEEEPHLVTDTVEETSIDEDFNNLNDEDVIYGSEIDETKSDHELQDPKTTELLFVSKYMNNSEIKNDEDKNYQENIEDKTQEAFEAGSQTNEVIVLEKDEMTSLTKKIELEAMIRNEITNNFKLALDNKNLVMVTAEDQLRTEEIELISNDSNSANNIKHNTTEENISNIANVHLTDSITSDLLSNLDLIVLTRKDDVGNAGSDSGIYMSKNASRITTLTFRESQVINQQPIDDKPSKIEGENASFNSNIENNVDEEKKNHELQDDLNKINEENKELEEILDYDIETQMNQEAILESLKENYARQTKNPDMVYAQAEADIKTMIKELLRETEDIKESIIATKLRSKNSSAEMCKEIVEDMINFVKEDIPMEADMKRGNEKETVQETSETIQEILNTIIGKVYSTVEAKAEENAVSVNYCLVRNHFHDKSKKHDSRVVTANKLFRAFYKIKRNFNTCVGPKVTVINLSPTSQRFLRSDEKLTNKIRRSAALLMALYEEMRDYSYYSCTSNILCDLYESMSKNERYLNHQQIPRGSNFITNVNSNVFFNYQTITDVDLKVESNEEPETSTVQFFDKPNCSTSNEEGSSVVLPHFKNLPTSTSNSSIYSDEEEIPFSGILPNLRYTYHSQEEINSDEEMMKIDNNVAVNAGRDLGLDVPLTESLSIDSIHADIAINESENFIILKDLSMA
nr:putative leucine-rich repeat-containing protein DDB_G0290503 isoform X1 [Onthophagus taurus]